MDGALYYDSKKLALTSDLNAKVDKITGKQLSTEDYTTAEKTKLSGIADSANNYTHPAAHAIDFITGLTAALGDKADSSALSSHTGNTDNPHAVTKTQAGLGNVDNTADLEKPVSTAAQAAFAEKNGDTTEDFNADDIYIYGVLNGVDPSSFGVGLQEVTYTGVIDGNNAVFVTDVLYDEIFVELNGVKYTSDYYTYVGNTLTFIADIPTGWDLKLYANKTVDDALYNPPLVEVSADYTVLQTDSMIECDATAGDMDVTLLNPTTCRGKTLCIKKVDNTTYKVILVGTINGVIDDYLDSQDEDITIYSNGTVWKTRGF